MGRTADGESPAGELMGWARVDAVVNRYSTEWSRNGGGRWEMDG